MKWLSKKNAKVGMEVSIILDGEFEHYNSDKMICADGHVTLAIKNRVTGKLLELRDEMYLIRE